MKETKRPKLTMAINPKKEEQGEETMMGTNAQVEAREVAQEEAPEVGPEAAQEEAPEAGPEVDPEEAPEEGPEEAQEVVHQEEALEQAGADKGIENTAY